LLEGTVTETDEMKITSDSAIAEKATPVVGDKQLEEVEQKIDPSVLSNPLPESYEWTTRQLTADALGFLTRNGIEARTDGMDIIVPVSTFADKFVFCLMGRDRSFADDPCFQGSYKRNSRLGGLPQFKGEPSKVDVQVSMDLVQAAGSHLAEFKQDEFQGKEIVSQTKAVEVQVVSEQPTEVLDFLAQDQTEVKECLNMVMQKALVSEVKTRVEDTIKQLRGRVD
jgi:hypothetical protein